MRKNRSASGCAALAARYCRMTGVSAPVAFAMRECVSEVRRARNGDTAQVDEDEPLRRRVDDPDLTERADEAHRLRVHRRRGAADADGERAELAARRERVD